MRIGMAMAALLAAVVADAAVIRKLPAISVVENETASVDAMKATSVRSSNDAVFSAALRESGEAVVSGTRLGEASLDYVDARGVFATRPVTVVPAYWDVLRRMFSEDPEISIDIVGDKVVLSGATANVDTLRRVERAQKLDEARIVHQVTYSTAQIGELVTDFLARANVTNVGVNVVGHEVCLSGRMYDAQSIEQLRKRVQGFVKDYPGITVNTDELRIYKQKILISIEFVAYNDTLSRNLGFEGPRAITAGMDWNFGYEHKKTTSGGHDSSDSVTRGGQFRNESSRKRSASSSTSADGASDPTSTSSSESSRDSSRSLGESFSRTLTDATKKGNSWAHDWKGGTDVKVSGVQATINLLKQNGAAKKLYSTTLSTQSGIEAEFQNGGTIYMETADLYKSDTKEIEYGYIIKTTPLIIDANTVNLDFDLNLKQDMGREGNGNDYKITRYQTKSKYLMRPGESIVLSGYKYNSEDEKKRGTPWLSNIPWIGQYLFGNTVNEVEMDEMLLVVTVDWVVEDDGNAARQRIDEMKSRKVEVEMP